MGKRTTIILPEDLEVLVKKYQSDSGISLIGAISKGLRNLLKTEGYISESKDLEIEEVVSEVKRNGVTREKILSALYSLMEAEVCNE